MWSNRPQARLATNLRKTRIVTDELQKLPILLEVAHFRIKRQRLLRSRPWPDLTEHLSQNPAALAYTIFIPCRKTVEVSVES